jgi:hypothetical protein
VSFTAEYSLWFTIVCLLLAATGSWFLYRKNPLDLTGKKGVFVTYALTGLRFVALFILSFLLLGPLMKLVQTRTEKPIIVLAIDGSESIVATRDSAFYRNGFTEQIHQLEQSLAGDFEVKTYTIGESLSESFEGNFKEKQTNLSNVFDVIKNNYSNQNLGAVVLATDGLYNDGNNPLYVAKDLRAPVYTIALGDTVQQKDLLIQQVKYNQLVYSGNFFPLQIDVRAYGYPNNQSKLTITHNGQTEFSATVSINNATSFQSIPVSLEAKQPGTQHYIVSLSPLSGEVSTLNNRFDVFINVIDGKQKVALVYLAPHPDIAAFKSTIEQNENYSLTALSFDKVSAASLKDYSLIIFHQLPGTRGEGANLVKTANDQHLPALFVLGAQTGLPYLNSAVPTINITTNRNAVNEVTASVRPDFSLFTMGTDELESIKKFPPLYAPYGTYTFTIEQDVLFAQQIGYVKTDFPLIVFGKSAGFRVGFICAEGWWKWSLFDATLGNRKVLGSLTGKIVQYLAAKDDRSRFRINGARRFHENEAVSFDAEVYNESYELIHSSDVSLVIKNAAGKQFPYSFSKTQNAYSLTIGLMPVGNYTYEASTTVGNQSQRLKGSFTVVPLQVEYLQTTANHQLLNEIASETQGTLFYPNDLEPLKYAIQNSESIKPVIYQQDVVKSWINLKWIFFLMLTMLSIEWFIRKWNGTI